VTPRKRAARLALAVALAAAAIAMTAPARAFVRTTDRRSGKPLAWRFPVVPWHVNRDWPGTSESCRATPAGDPTLDALRASFGTWEQPCANLQLPFAGEVPATTIGEQGSHENVVVFRRGWCSQHPQAKGDPCMNDPDVDCGAIYGCFEDSASCIDQPSCADWSIVALTSVLYDPASGRIIDADIEVNAWDGVVEANATLTGQRHGWYFTCDPSADQLGLTQCGEYGQPGCVYMDLQNTVTHEVGHVVGLRHPCTNDPSREPDLPPCNPNAPGVETMDPQTVARETKKRTLSADDVAGVCAIYPDMGGGCGCGGGEGAGAASLLLAALAVRPRRRVR
jgi:hypothetical protein